jgi:hypothetical protein
MSFLIKYYGATNRIFGFDELTLQDRSCTICIHVLYVVEAIKSIFFQVHIISSIVSKYIESSNIR